MANNNNDSTVFWVGGGLLIALAVVAFSLWGPMNNTGPEDIMPAAGSPAYVDDTPTSTRSGITADDMNNSGAAGGTTSTTPSGGPINNDGSTTTTE